jgi:hypothetical protein
MDTEPLVFVGIDWASTEHQVCLTGTGDPVQRVFAHDASGIGAMVDWLCAQAEQPNQVAVAIETPHGPIVEALMDRGIAVFAINPKQLDRFRDRFSPAGAKDDRRDALVLASSLRTDRHCFRRVEALDPAVVELREWSRMAEELKGERVRLTNRVRQQLWRYYPQALDLTDDIGADWVLALWAKAPTPADARRLCQVAKKSRKCARSRSCCHLVSEPPADDSAYCRKIRNLAGVRRLGSDVTRGDRNDYCSTDQEAFLVPLRGERPPCGPGRLRRSRSRSAIDLAATCDG